MKSKEYFCKYGGDTCYFRDPGKIIRHRESGLPSIEYPNGDKIYFENNQWHRLDGLAVDWIDYKGHFLNGKRLFGKTLR